MCNFYELLSTMIVGFTTDHGVEWSVVLLMKTASCQIFRII